MGAFGDQLSDRLRTKRKLNAHKLVYATAVEMAGALYELLMRDNTLYAEWKASCPQLTGESLQLMFCELMAPKLLEESRATLAKLLATPISSHLKDEIHDALLKDAIFVPGRRAAYAKQTPFEDKVLQLKSRTQLQ